MRTHTPFLALPVLLSLACSAVEAQSNPVVSEGMRYSPGGTALHTTLAMPSPLTRGDTVRARDVLVNLADTAITAAANPCRIRFGGTLQLRVIGEERQDCPAAAVRLAPGDSLPTERVAVVVSAPGEFSLEVARSGTSADGQGSWNGSSMNRVTVVEPASAARLARAPRRPSTRIPFVLHVRGTSAAGITEQDLESIVTQSGYPEGALAMRLDPDAPAAAPGLLVLVVEVEWQAGGGVGTRMGYVQRAWKCGESSGTADSVGSPAVFGADFSARLREQFRAYSRCSPRVASAGAR